jgi:hypothetical protein
MEDYFSETQSTLSMQYGITFKDDFEGIIVVGDNIIVVDKDVDN